MALTDVQKLSVKLCLGLPTASTALDSRFASLTSAEETRIAAIVTEYDAIANKDTALNVGGFSKSDMMTKFTLRNNLALLMGVTLRNVTERLS